MATTYTEVDVDIDQLLLDPNNFRFQDEPDFVFADVTRVAEPGVQERATKKIRSENLGELKASIISNGFLAVERLVVREYAVDGDGSQLYLVLEGNRRAASLKWIREDDRAGVVVPVSVLESTRSVPVIVMHADEGEVDYLSIMGVRHVGGIKQWGGYQRAKLVGQLRDAHGLETSDVAERLGMSKHEVNRRYRALKALQQMLEDEDFGDFASPTMYPMFHEAVSLPSVRSWLKWTDADLQFTDEEELRKFYGLVTPGLDDESEDETPRDPKVTSYAQVRDLRDILANPEAKRILLDPTRTFGEALGVAKAEELSESWKSEVADAIGALKSIGLFDVEALSEGDRGALSELRELVDRILATSDRLASAEG